MNAPVRPLVSPGVTFVLGPTYCGKTTLAREILEARRPAGRALIFDPSLSRALDGLPELKTRTWARRFLTGRDSHGAWVRVVRFARLEDYAWLASTVRGWRGVTWVLDDAATLMESPAIAAAAQAVAITGRHMGNRAGVELWFIGHRPCNAPPAIRSQVSAVYSFRQREPRDLELLTTWCGGAFAQSVSQLEDRAFLAWPPSAPVPSPRRRRSAARARATV